MRRLALVGVAAAGIAAAGVVGMTVGGRGSANAEAATTDGAWSRRYRSSGAISCFATTWDGTLSYADGRTLSSSAAGTVTRLPAQGKVVTRGLPPVRGGTRAASGSSTGRCRSGAASRWGVSDGRDVEQLERNLVELGYDPERMTVY